MQIYYVNEVEYNQFYKIKDLYCWNDIDFVLKMITNNGMMIRFVKSKMLTFELCKAAVEQNGMALQYVPKEFKKRLYKNALENTGESIIFVESNDLNIDLMKLAIEKNIEPLRLITNPPFEFLKYAVVRYENTFDLLPEKYHRDELCEYALIHNPQCKKYIKNPKYAITKEEIADSLC